jgi:alpha-1,4-digalacturonate transport system substrate-binding protein
MKKAMISVFLVLCLTMGACQRSNKETAGGEKEAPLTVIWFNDANESDIYLAVMDDYYKANPRIKLDFQVVAYNEYEQKLKMLIAGGTPPEAARLTNNHISNLIDSLLPLDGYVPNLEGVKKNYMPASLAYATNGRNELIAFPTEATANGMLVNKTAFKNAGIDVDEVSKNWTWQSWEDTIKKVLAANPNIKYGLALDRSMHRFATLMYQYGGHYLNDTQTGMNFSHPGTVQAIKMVKDLHDRNLMPPSVWLGSENAAQLFQAGIVACHIGGSWNINSYNQTVKDFEWGAVHNPKGTTVSSVPGGKFIASFKDCASPREAVDMMLVFADKDHTARYAKDTFNLSSRIDTVIDYPSNNQDFKVFGEDLKATPAYTANEQKNLVLNSVTPYVLEQMAEILLGKVSIEAAVRDIDAKGTTYFKK